MSKFIKALAKAGFHKAIMDYAFQSQSRPLFENMECCFIDSKGRKYYRYTDLKEMSQCMQEQLMILQMEIESRIKGTDLDEWIATCEKILNGNSKTRITDFGHMIGALKDRRQLSFDPRLLMEIAALLYVREDENPHVYSKAIHLEKYEQFKADAQGGLRDFFVQVGLQACMPSTDGTEQEFVKSSEDMMKKIERWNALLQKISTGVSPLSSTQRTNEDKP